MDVLNSSVNTVHRLRNGYHRNCCPIPSRARKYFLPCNVGLTKLLASG